MFDGLFDVVDRGGERYFTKLIISWPRSDSGAVQIDFGMGTTTSDSRLDVWPAFAVLFRYVIPCDGE